MVVTIKSKPLPRKGPTINSTSTPPSKGVNAYKRNPCHMRR